ncbi:tumor necrosis factor alpha-induced protein 2-like isoform X3 [Solea senegalensis]|uniref:Tumor necrosis factor alpha-induced protein 2-like isoform X3 n=2 Tax=Solea senegalensis TaxID=28829 RepID=A0AAV6RU22_SOLSE|nr:tumor necrosis factor alpha-induced protein 2-like isoform X3 [Solea senegalensis]
MWRCLVCCSNQQDCKGGVEENPAVFCNHHRQQNHMLHEGEASWEEEELLEEVSRGLIDREEQLFSRGLSSEDEEQLQKDFNSLKKQLCLVVENIFTSSSSRQLDTLRSAVVSIQQQEAQDQRWAGRPDDRRPTWRPLKCVSSHNALLQSIVESRLREAAEDESSGGGELSSAVKRQVYRMGRRVEDDLLLVVRTVQDCYPSEMDILNICARLYHQWFSAQLMEIVASGLNVDDCSYVLFMVNHHYPDSLLKHTELHGKMNSSCVSSLLLQDHLQQLEDQYLSYKEDKVKIWLNKILKTEEESWLKNKEPEIIDSYFYSPLAVDAIQVIDSFLTEFGCVIRDQSKTQRITAHLESFLSSYEKSFEAFVRGDHGNHGNVASVVKAQLVCEQQLRDYITESTVCVCEQQRRRCLNSLTALRDYGYRYFTCPLHVHLKVCYSKLWTPVWLDGSLVVDSLLDTLSDQLMALTDLKPACRKSLLSVLHQDVVLRYLKRVMKITKKSREQQVGGAQQMNEDAQKINNFFEEMGCSESLWLCDALCCVAEVLRLQDPHSVHLEVIALARKFPDLSDDHVSALLSVKNGLSAGNIRSIRRSVKENRPPTNHSPPFFSRIHLKQIDKFKHHARMFAR